MVENNAGRKIFINHKYTVEDMNDEFLKLFTDMIADKLVKAWRDGLVDLEGDWFMDVEEIEKIAKHYPEFLRKSTRTLIKNQTGRLQEELERNLFPDQNLTNLKNMSEEKVRPGRLLKSCIKTLVLGLNILNKANSLIFLVRHFRYGMN